MTLLNLKGAFSVNNENELSSKVNLLLSDTDALNKTGTICKNFVLNGCGATDTIMKYVTESVAFLSMKPPGIADYEAEAQTLPHR